MGEPVAHQRHPQGFVRDWFGQGLICGRQAGASCRACNDDVSTLKHIHRDPTFQKRTQQWSSYKEEPRASTAPTSPGPNQVPTGGCKKKRDVRTGVLPSAVQRKGQCHSAWIIEWQIPSCTMSLCQ
eukprot:189833-Amphidinium_carterae.1